MKLLYTFIFILFSFINAYAQDPSVQDLKNEAAKSIKKDPTDTIQKKWKLGGLFNFNLNQGSQSNWSAGDNFHIVVRMCGECSASSYKIIIQNS